VVRAVLGVGILRGVSTVRRRTLAGIVIGWFLTPTISSFVATVLVFASHLEYLPA
jgi:phosphate/sulfate permease